MTDPSLRYSFAVAKRLLVLAGVATIAAAAVYLRRHPASTVGMSDRAPTPNALKKAFSDSEKTYERIKEEGEARAAVAGRAGKKAVRGVIDSVESGIDKIRPASLEKSPSSSTRSTLV